MLETNSTPFTRNMGILDLPDELLLSIGEYVTSESDLNSLHQVNNRLYRIFDEYRYKYNAKHHEGHALYWAARYGNATTARKSVIAGTSLDPRPWPFTWLREYPFDRHPSIKKHNRGEYWVEDPLTQTIMWNQPGITKMLLELGAYQKSMGVNSAGQPERLILWAATRNRVSALKELLRHGVDVNTKNELERTALIVAARKGNFETVEALLENGADTEVPNMSTGWRPLHWAARLGHLSVVKLLLDSGAEIDAQTSRSLDTPILLAAKHHEFDALEILFDRGANLELAGKENRTVLFHVVRKGSENLTRKFLGRGARPDITCLFEALSDWERDDHYERAKLLLEYGADPNAPIHTPKGPKYLLPWVLRQWYLNVSVIELLLEYGVDVNITGPGYFPPLLSVVFGEYFLSAAWILLDHGADVNASNEKGETPLLICAAKGNVGIAELLLNHGADPNINVKGQNLLTRAAKWGSGDIINLLNSSEKT